MSDDVKSMRQYLQALEEAQPEVSGAEALARLDRIYSAPPRSRVRVAAQIEIEAQGVPAQERVCTRKGCGRPFSEHEMGCFCP